jgi:uncharacterized protein with von Willebrand factor type A (vWA) domain
MITEKDFIQFIEFGGLFDKETRRYLVQYIRKKIFPQPLDELEITPPELDYVCKALDIIFSHEKSLQVLQSNENLAKQVIQDTLQQLKKSFQNVKKEHPYRAEWDRLQSWKDRPLFLFAETWYHATNWIQEHYSREELDVRFYVHQFDTTFRDLVAFQQFLQQQNKDFVHEIEPIIADLLNRWEALVLKKILSYEAEKFEQAQQEFADLLQTKIMQFEQITNLLAPFTNELGRFWDLSKGTWKKSSLETFHKYEQLIQNEEKIKELAEMLGRWTDAEVEIEEELFETVIAKSKYIRSDDYKTEINGLENSNDFNRMLPAEAALLSEKDTETLFYKKYAEKALLSFRYEGQKKTKGENTLMQRRSKPKEKERGPFIICIDTSGSMEGVPEYVAKVLCFAIIRMAAKQKRHCYLISFAVGVQTINLLELEHSLDKVADFLLMRFDGGTSINPALIAALDMLQTKEYTNADLLMVSDFIMYDIREDIIKRIHSEQSKGTSFHSLTINNAPNYNILDVFDNCWIYKPEDRTIMHQLAKDLKKVSKY